MKRHRWHKMCGEVNESFCLQCGVVNSGDTDSMSCPPWSTPQSVEPPKKKVTLERWVNVYKSIAHDDGFFISRTFESIEDSKRERLTNIIACVKVLVEFEVDET